MHAYVPAQATLPQGLMGIGWTVDFGDGSAPFTEALTGKYQAPCPYVGTRTLHIYTQDPYGTALGATHIYASPGTYRITVSLTTAACDGSRQQNGSVVTSIVWPGSTPAPLPS